jgi:hypothetical protein
VSKPSEATRSRLREQGGAKARSAHLRVQAAADALKSPRPARYKEAAEGSRSVDADTEAFHSPG